MSIEKNEVLKHQELRKRALSRLTGKADVQDPRANSSAALAVLHNLASSPATAEDSLKLLHELQVHQVELDLQDEELRRSVVELESALHRQVQLYDFSPAGCFTIDRSMALHELNRSATSLLGLERDAVLGHPLREYLDPGSGDALHAVMTRVAQGSGREGCSLRFIARMGGFRGTYAAVDRDPSGQHFLIACVEIPETAKTGSG